jgi:aminoglycoside phosphotransferase family enzyme/gluconate kinase
MENGASNGTQHSLQPQSSMPALPRNNGAGGDVLAHALQRRLEISTGRTVRRVETHISWVLLDGEHAWKIKKPVLFGFLNFTSLELRRRACEDELRLNRRLAPTLYLDVVPIYGTPDAPCLGGGGEPIEYALRMRQFDSGALLSERLASGCVTGALIDRLAARLAAFHQAAAVAPAVTAHGSAPQIRAQTAQVLAGLGSHDATGELGKLWAWCDAQGRHLAATFDRRKRQGWVRECHGDLHLENIVALGDDITAFDCIEFDPDLRWIDVQCDIAFLTMDLTAHNRGDLAWRFLDRWLEVHGDYPGLAVLRYYGVYRALVRALVISLRRSEGLEAAGTDYIAVARSIAEARDARLLITHGLSGSGKSYVAQRLLEFAGAIRLRSDVERKRLFGLSALDVSSARAPQDIYARAATQRTYEALYTASAEVLDAGYPVIVDATFLHAHERDVFRNLARGKGVRFSILYCHADDATLRERVQARRRRADDPSEADLAVLERQRDFCEPLTQTEKLHCIEIDTGGPIDVQTLARRWLHESEPD